MQLSVVVPTHRADLLAISRIAQLCAVAGNGIEVIIRDNSGDAAKRSMLQQFAATSPAKIVCAAPCEAMENFAEARKLATGEFLFFAADDDFVFEQALLSLPAVIDQIGSDAKVSGIAGRYVMESVKSSLPILYANTDSPDIAARVSGFLNNSPPNLLFYAAVRRPLVNRIFEFWSTCPFSFSFHDIITCLLYLLNGRYVSLNRLFYLYDLGVWQTRSGQLNADLAFYTRAGMDPAINQLHWFICGAEGAALVLGSDLFPKLPASQRQLLANIWFGKMQNLMRNDRRGGSGSPYSGAAAAIFRKWEQFQGGLAVDAMLTDIAGFIALFSTERAEKYRKFWSAFASV